MTQRKPQRSAAAAVRGPRRETLIDARALLIAVGVLALAGSAALVWRLSAAPPPLKKIEEFQFSAAEAKPEEVKIKDPVQPIVKERLEEMKDDQKEERPHIEISTNPAPENPTEVVKSKQVDLDTPRIDPTATQSDIPDTPVEITQVQPEETRALTVIAADVPSAAEIFAYKEPTPSDRPATTFVNAGPRPGKRTSVLPQMFGEQDQATVGKLGPMDVNLFGNGDAFRNIDRSGALRSRSAVDAALRWLAQHQEPSGQWDTTKHQGEPSGSLACTALATLAFLGSGSTTRRGEYRRNVVRGIEHLLKHQKPDGRFQSAANENLYTHAICTIAIAEAYGRAHDEALQAAAQRAIDFSAAAVGRDGGWRYEPKPPASDSSVTAWFIQALKTAKLANLRFDPALFNGAQLYLDSLTHLGATRESNGIVGYEFKPNQDYTLNDSHSHGRPALTAAGMVIRRFTGMGAESGILVRAAGHIRQAPPRWGDKDFYYWYYATYAMHNMGGEHRLWWNSRLRDVLLEHQVRTGDQAGSWDPRDDLWARPGGRVYTTALGALCLMVYYRFSDSLGAFGVAQDIDDLFLQGL